MSSLFVPLVVNIGYKDDVSTLLLSFNGCLHFTGSRGDGVYAHSICFSSRGSSYPLADSFVCL